MNHSNFSFGRYLGTRYITRCMVMQLLVSLISAILPLGDMLSGCAMDAGAGAGSIFQEAQHETGENSGVGPLPADINMVEPARTRAYAPTQQFTTQSYRPRRRTTDLTRPRARSKLSQNTEERACRSDAPTARLLPLARLGKNHRQTITKNLHVLASSLRAPLTLTLLIRFPNASKPNRRSIHLQPSILFSTFREIP